MAIPAAARSLTVRRTAEVNGSVSKKVSGNGAIQGSWTLGSTFRQRPTHGQAVTKLNATGQRSGDLLPYAAESIRRARLLDQAAEEVRKRIRQ